MKRRNAILAACLVDLSTGAELHLVPAGAFRGRDGRPADAPAWRLDQAAAARIIEQLRGQQVELVVDYEHQTLRSASNGQPAPAAGWVDPGSIEWREGRGLVATRVRWTDKARAAIDAGEYRYLSPVFLYEQGTGQVLSILHFAITNTPALDSLDEVTLRAAANLNANHLFEDESMNDELRKLLGLPTTAGEEQITAAVRAALAAQQCLAALRAKLELDETADVALAVASLQSAAAKPDPAKFVPVETVSALQGELATLKGELLEDKVQAVVAAALDAGKLLPAQESWAVELGRKDLAALNTFIAGAPVILALKGNQTRGKPPEDDKPGDLTESQLAICAQMGLDPEEYKKTLTGAA